MSEPGWWKEFLLEIYREYRLFSGWLTIYELHDEEDQNYFNMLDQMDIKSKMIMGAPNES